MILSDEKPPLEEALPEEYAVTQRKPLLDESGLKKVVKVNGVAEGEKSEQENTTESELKNEVK